MTVFRERSLEPSHLSKSGEKPKKRHVCMMKFNAQEARGGEGTSVIQIFCHFLIAVQHFQCNTSVNVNTEVLVPEKMILSVLLHICI
jgi:hypothetical protein